MRSNQKSTKNVRYVGLLKVIKEKAPKSRFLSPIIKKEFRVSFDFEHFSLDWSVFSFLSCFIIMSRYYYYWYYFTFVLLLLLLSVLLFSRL